MTAPRPARRWRRRPMRFRSSEKSAEQDRKAEDAGGRALSPRRRTRCRSGGDQSLAGPLQCGAGAARIAKSRAAARTSPAPRRERLAHVANDAVIRPPFFCDYGYNIRLGDNVFLNFNCVILDVVEVRIGDRTQIGPAVQIYAADHPRDARTRRDGLEFGRPVRIGRDVWIGGGAIILP